MSCAKRTLFRDKIKLMRAKVHHSQCWHLERVCEKVESCVHEVLKTKTKHSSREVAVKSHIVLQLSPDASIGSDVPLLS